MFHMEERYQSSGQLLRYNIILLYIVTLNCKEDKVMGQ